MISKIKLATRIKLLNIMIIICFMLVLTWIYYQFKEKMYEAKYLKTRSVVESAYGIIHHYGNLSKKGIMPAEDAKNTAKELIRNLRYEDNEYFWINDMRPFMIMHPFKSEQEGKDLSEFKDPHGKKPFIAMADICKAKGEGFVDYYWPRPGETLPVPKISYVKAFSEWGWIIGSGIYVDDVEKEIAKITAIVSIVMIIITVFIFFLSYFMSESISKPIYRVLEGLDQGAVQLSGAAGEISSTSQFLSENASNLAAFVEETSQSLEMITHMSRTTSELTRGAELLMKQNIEKSGHSLISLIELTRGMAQIEADSGQIVQIIKTIDEIAFQTQLLALNAAVEAARAGEAGLGFAVVADEVRNLAIRVTAAAKNIQELLDTTVSRVSQSARSIKEVNNDFDEIIESATSMGEKTAKITEESKDLTVAIEQISLAVKEIDKVIQDVAASSQESAAASEELSAQSLEIKNFIKELLLIVGGKKCLKP